MIDLGNLKATISIDDSSASEKLKDFSNNVEETEGKLGGFTSKVGGLAKTLAGGMAGAVTGVVGAMGTMSAQALETTAMIDKFSATCNVSTDEFQKLDGVFQTVGWSMEDAAGDFVALSEKMLEASETGEGEAYEMFQKLGVAVEDSSGKLRNTGDVFNDMVLALQNVSNETERQAIASIMLGTTSEELAPILSMTNEEFLKMKDGINVIDEEQLQKAEEFKESWDMLKQTFSSVVTELGVQLMPMFQSLVDWVVENMPMIQEVIEVVFEVIGTVIDTVSKSIQRAIDWFNNLLSNNEDVKKGLSEVWNGVKTMFSTFFKEVQELLSAFVSLCTKLWNKYGDDVIAIIEPLWNVLKTLFETGFDVLMGLVDGFTALLNGDFTALKESLIDIVTALWDGVKDLFSTAIESITDFVPRMFEIGKDLFSSLWDGLKSIWNSISDWVSDKVSWLMDKLMFWRDSTNEMSSSGSINGSHEGGINYVPYDGYRAELHKGERVLTAEESRNYSQMSTSGIEEKLDRICNKLDRLPRNMAIENRF